MRQHKEKRIAAGEPESPFKLPDEEAGVDNAANQLLGQLNLGGSNNATKEEIEQSEMK